MFLDITKAYANAPVKRKIYVDLPKAIDPNNEWCGQLHKSMNGTRDGAKNWGSFFADLLVNKMSFGFVRGKAIHAFLQVWKMGRKSESVRTQMMLP